MQNTTVYQGVGSVYPAQVLNPDGTSALNVYTGSEPLFGAIWSGGVFQIPTFDLAPVWHVTGGGPAGRIDVPFPPNLTANAWAGQYTAIITLADFSKPLLTFTVTILPAPPATLPAITQAVTSGSFTRALADIAIFKRVQLPLGQVKIPIDSGSPISQFDDPISRALAFMKIVALNPVFPNDIDIAAVSRAKWQELIDISEAEVLTWAITILTMHAGLVTDERWPDYSYRKDPLAIMYVQKTSTDKMARCRKLYGYDTPVLRYGVINLGFQANVTQNQNAESWDAEVS